MSDPEQRHKEVSERGNSPDPDYDRWPRRAALLGRLIGLITGMVASVSAIPVYLVLRSVVESAAGTQTSIAVSSDAFFALSVIGASAALLLAARGAKARTLRRELARLRRRADELEHAYHKERMPGGAEKDATRGGEPPPRPPRQVGQAPSQEPEQPEQAGATRWSPAIIASLLVALIGGGFGVTTAYIAKQETPPDCLTYVKELTALDAKYKPEQLKAALSEVRLAAYEDRCGDAEKFITRLHE